jgi:hypothetical protein
MPQPDRGPSGAAAEPGARPRPALAATLGGACRGRIVRGAPGTPRPGGAGAELRRRPQRGPASLDRGAAALLKYAQAKGARRHMKLPSRAHAAGRQCG